MAIYLPLLIGRVGYLIWSRFTESGLIGWLDAIQARHDGTYDAKLSSIVGLFYLMFLVGAVVTLLTKVLPRTQPGIATATSMPPAKKPNLRRQVLLTGIAILEFDVAFLRYCLAASAGIRPGALPLDPT